MHSRHSHTTDGGRSDKDYIETIPIRLVSYSYGLIGGIFAGLLALSIFIKYPVTVQGPSKITTSKPPEIITLRNGGSIERLFVKNGDMVTSDQIVLVLRSQANYKDVVFIKNRLKTLNLRQIQISNKLELSDDLNELMSFTHLKLTPFKEELYTLIEILSDYLRDEKNIIQETKITFHNLTKSYTNKDLRLLQSNQEQILEELQIAKQNEVRYKDLLIRGVVSEIEYEKSNKEKFRIEQKLTNNLINISRLTDRMSQTSSNVLLDELGYELDEERKLASIITSLSQLDKVIERWEEQYLIIARSDGKIHFLERLNVNSIIDINSPILLIENKNINREIIAEITLSPSKYGKVEIGHNIEIMLDSYPETEFGFLRGKVVETSEVPNENSNYTVIASLENGLRTNTNNAIPYREGLIGTGQIITENLSLMKRILRLF